MSARNRGLATKKREKTQEYLHKCCSLGLQNSALTNISPIPFPARCRPPPQLFSICVLRCEFVCKQAFAYNFLSALSAVLGTIIILALGGEMSASDISIILLIGAGSFIFIALAELMPEAMAVTRATSQQGGNAVVLSQGRKLATFVLGGILVGIPLIFDQHCEADGHDH